MRVANTVDGIVSRVVDIPKDPPSWCERAVAEVVAWLFPGAKRHYEIPQSHHCDKRNFQEQIIDKFHHLAIISSRGSLL